MTKSEKLFLFFCVLGGLFLRFFKLKDRLSFDWDQENFAWLAKELISDGKFTLLGAPTSVGGIHLGPFYTYLSDLAYFIFRQDPLGGGVLAALTGVATIISIYLVGRELFGSQVAKVSALIYTFSFSLIVWDLVAWNPSPFHLYVLWTIWALVKTIKNQKYTLMLFPLLGLGLHLHIASLVLFPLVLVYLLTRKVRISRKIFLFSLFLFLISISPLIIFDIRHGFFNVKQFINFLLFQGSSFSAQGIQAGSIGGLVWNQFFSYISSILPEEVRSLILLLLWFSVPLVWFKARKKQRISLTIIYLLIVLTFIFYSIYPGHVTEYYLMILTPFSIFLVSLFLVQVFNSNKYSKIAVVLLMPLFIFLNLANWFPYDKVLSLADKERAIDFIIADSAGKPFRVSITTQLGYDNGFKYLLWYKKAKVSTDLKDKIYTIVAPAGAYGIKSLKEFHGVGVIWDEGQKIY